MFLFIFLIVIGVIIYGIAIGLIFSFVNSSFYFRDVRAEWGQAINLFRVSGEQAAPIEVTT
jgi:predicted membrane chloride channel (bestrophin family)